MGLRAGSIDQADLKRAAHDGVIAARALVALGVPETTVYARCRDGGPWQRLSPGIVLLSTGHPTPNQLVTAALLHGGPHALLTGPEACRRHGLRRGVERASELHALVPHSRQVRSSELVHVERTHRMPDAVSRGGVPLAPVVRSVIDAARRMRSEREITELLSDAVQRRLCTVAQLATELGECGRRGSAAPRRILRDVETGVRSIAERDAKQLWQRSTLPEPWWNAPVYDSCGRLLGIVDAWWDDVALAWEINSYTWHLAPEPYAREQDKRARFTAEGVPVLPTLPTRLRTEPAAVLDELHRAYAHAASRPRPAVRGFPSQQGGLAPAGLQ